MTPMHRSRTRHRHHDDPDVIRDVAVFVTLAAEATDAGERELLTAKADVAAQLERLDDALDAAFEVLAPEEFTSLVWRLPNPGRTDFLRDLPMPSAKKPTPLAASHGLARLRHWPPDRRLYTARFITTPVTRGLAAPLRHWRNNRNDAMLGAALAEDARQANAVRLMVLARWYDRPEIVAALRAVLTGGLALPTWPADVVDDIVSACSRLESLWLEALTGPARADSTDDGGADAAGDDRTLGEGSLGWNAAGGTDVDAGGTDVVTNVSPQPVGRSRPSASPSTVALDDVGPDALTAAASQVRRLLEVARASAHQAAGALDAARIPSANLLEPISELALAVGQGETLLVAVAPDVDPPDDCEVLADALDVAAAAMNGRSNRDQLNRLARLAGPESYRAVIEGVHHLAQTLLDADTRNDEQQQHIEALTALLRLIDAVAAGETSDVMALHTTAQQKLPSDLASVLVIALLGQLTTVAVGGDDHLDDTQPGSTEPAATSTLPVPVTTVDLPQQRPASGKTETGRGSIAKAVDTGGVPASAVRTPPADSADTPARFTSLTDLVASVRAEDSAVPNRDATTEPATDDTAQSAGVTAPAVLPATPSRSAGATGSGSLVSTGVAATLDGATHVEVTQDPPSTVGTTTDRAHPDTAAVPASDHDEDAAGDELVASLLRARRYCLAFHAATALGSDTRAKALRVLTFAEAVRSETGPTAVALRTALDDLHLHHFDGDRPAQLALLAAAVRAALVTANPNAGEVVTDLVGVLRELPHVAALAGAIGTASARGLLSSSAMLTALAPIAGADNDIAAAAEVAAAERDKPRTLRFQRANQIVDRWWSRTGHIGELLDIAANDRHVNVDIAAEKLRKLAKREDLLQLLTRDDAELRGHGSRAMEGASRRRLIDHARESLDAVGAWIDAVRANRGTDRGALPVPSLLTELRNQVRSEWAAAETELQALAATSDNVLLAASAAACWQSLDRSVDLLDGTSLRGVEPEPNVALNRELLRCPSLPLDSTLTPSRAVTTHDIAIAASTSWGDAFAARLADEDYVAARIIFDAVADNDPDHVEGMFDQLEQNTTRSRAELRTLRAEVAAQVEKAARLGQLGQTANAQVLAQLEAARPDGDDLGAVRHRLADIRRRLPEYAHKAKQALRDRVSAELNRAASKSAESGVKVPENAAELIHDRIDAGDLATAEEYLLGALAGEIPPRVEPSSDLAAFMAVPDALAEGITSALVKAARDGKAFSGLDFSGLSPADRVTAGDGLDTWLQMRTDRPQRNQRMKFAIASALRLAGIEFTGDRGPHGLSGSPNRKWVDLTGVKRIGEPLVPAFGSITGDRLRLMLCWGVQDAGTLLTWVTQDQSNDPVVVALFATLSLTQRRALAKACSERQDRPVIVLDDAALAYLAAHGGGRFATTERILLPFAATNPYHPNATGKVPSEMFFGRREERGKILDPFGTSLLYGGRQLGKSALLQAGARHFELTLDRVAVYLSLPGGFGTTRKADDLWDMVADRLAERQITVPRRRARDAAKHVETAVTTWLGQNPNRRLVLLLDECDGFFDADAETGFAHTSRLRDLMNATDRRFKPVFAGLHQVQRFAHLPNQPLAGAHFGDPIAIGPLSPGPAYGLMFTPMETLGISFASDELIHRVLAYCNYQPKLLQLVGEALVREAFSRRGVDGPPYVIGDEELERVIGSDTVRQKVRETVQLTLNLDSRYKLIALVVALAALEHDADHAIGTSKLREECLAWWPEGFTRQGADEFRSLLEEMSGLGVLADTDGRWRLRSSNVLRLLGSADAIEEELFGEEWRTTLTALSAEQSRRTLPDGLTSPMTEKQLATLIERGNQLRIVVGTSATGIDRVRTLLAEEAGRIGARFTLHPVNSPATYRKELRGGEPGDRHRVVLSDLSSTRLDNALMALRQVEEIVPAAGVTRSVVALVDASVSEVFTAIGNPELGDIADRMVPLRRLSPDGLRSWVAELTENDRASCFGDTASQKLLMDATGGWTILLDEAVKVAAAGRAARRVCETITAKLGTAETAAMLVEAVGLAGDSTLALAFQELINYDDPMTAEDLVELFEVTDCGGARSADALRYLDVIVERHDDGRWEPEPVLAAAWKVARG